MKDVSTSEGASAEQYAFVRLHAREGEEDGVEQALREVVAATRTEPGCLGIHAFHSMRDRRLFYIHSHWVNAVAFQEHTATHVAVSRTRGRSARSAPRGDQDRDDRLSGQLRDLDEE